MLYFSKWLKEDAGPLGPGGSSIYVNDRSYLKKGVKPRRTTPDDEGASDDKDKCDPESVFGLAKKKCKK